VAADVAAAETEQRRVLHQQRKQKRGLRPRHTTTPAAETFVEESKRRREMVAARNEGSREAPARIAARVVVVVDEALVVVSPQRQPLRRDDVMEKLESTPWLGRVSALQGLLELVSKMSLSMQTVNVIPWELMTEQRDFYDKLRRMQKALRDQPSESDPRWSSTPPDPIPSVVFSFFHEEPDKKKPPWRIPYTNAYVGNLHGPRAQSAGG
jgi:hypothetical protein